jgi:hypothetical protein
MKVGWKREDERAGEVRLAGVCLMMISKSAVWGKHLLNI